MDKTLFAELVESMTQMTDIAKGRRQPSRVFDVSDADVRKIREASGLSQARFADVIRVDVGTLRNWEQGRRHPTGPARVLLEVLRVNPAAVLEAVHATSSSVTAKKKVAEHTVVPPSKSKPGAGKQAASRRPQTRRSA